MGGSRYNSRVLIDACIPFERLGDFPAAAEASPELLRAATEPWPQLNRSYGADLSWRRLP